PQAGTVRAMTAFTNPIETVARSDHPRIRRWTLQILAKVLKDRWRRWGHGGKVIESFVYAGRQTGSRDIVAEDSVIYNLREKSRLRSEFAHRVRNIFLSLRRERLLIAGPTAEGNHYDFLLGMGSYGASPGRFQQRAAHSHPRSAAQKLPP